MPAGTPTHVVWDWNGTLLDDVTHCIGVVNELLVEAGLEALTVDRYRSVFDFPVQRYYERLGFDLDAGGWESLAKSFIDRYDAGVHSCELREGARQVLSRNAGRGIRNTILSAAREDSIEVLAEHFCVRPFFDRIVGLSDHYASGKKELGVTLLEHHGVDSSSMVLVGDTVHDHEVAEAMGIPCVLLADGHQDRCRLDACGRPVVQSLYELERLLFS